MVQGTENNRMNCMGIKLNYKVGDASRRYWGPELRVNRTHLFGWLCHTKNMSHLILNQGRESKRRIFDRNMDCSNFIHHKKICMQGYGLVDNGLLRGQKNLLHLFCRYPE